MRVFGLMGFQAASRLPAIKGSLKQTSPDCAMNILNLTARPITLTDADTSRPIALTLNQIQQQLTHYPPSDYAWETAIQTVEDALYPLRDWRQNTQPLAVQGAELLLTLPHQTHPHGATITRDTLEHAFAVAAGYRPQSSLPPLPQTTDFCAVLLLLREWAHHLDYETLILLNESQTAA